MIYITLLLIAIMTAGHFLYGQFIYLKEIHTSPINELTEKTTDAMFHYNSIMFSISLAYILFVALRLFELNRSLVIFMSLWFIGSGIVNLYTALQSKVGVVKMFQWALFFLTGLCLLVTF